jgi:ribosomal protein L29
MVGNQRRFAGVYAASRISAPKLPELTPTEIDAVNRIADDYYSKLTLIIRAFPRREMIYQLVELGGVTQDMADKAKRLEQQRIDLLNDHVRELKETLGDDRFQSVTEWLQQPENAKMVRPFTPFIEPDTKVIPARK